jgi:hypothetical protein
MRQVIIYPGEESSECNVIVGSDERGEKIASG